MGATVPRGFLTAVAAKPVEIPERSSGRKELAQWLVSVENPLTARVFVNRIWHHLFGVGLVRTVDNFGTRGARPSHPELLDHLAVRFVEEGWSVKLIIRQIVLSRVYRMTSEHNPAAWRIDPENRLLWHAKRRRLEAEAMRDAVLAVSGGLDYGRGGPCLGIEIPGNIAGLDNLANIPNYVGKTTPEHVVNRRTVYLPLYRKRPVGELEILSIFDFPDPNQITGARAATTVPTQALFLMNSPFLKAESQRAAARLLAETGRDDAARVARLHLLALGRPASDEELQQALVFLGDYEHAIAARAKPADDSAGGPDDSAGGPDDSARGPEDPAGRADDSTQVLARDSVPPRLQAWTQYCHGIFASSEFLFRE